MRLNKIYPIQYVINILNTFNKNEQILEAHHLPHTFNDQTNDILN